MPDVILYIFLYLAIIIFDMMPLIKKKEKKSLLVYMPVLLFTLVINVLHGLGVHIPSPSGPIKDMVSMIFGIK